MLSVTEILNRDDKVRKVDVTNENQYCHPTYFVNDLLDYMYITELIRKSTSSETFLDTYVCYRGMENLNWALEPGILVNNLLSEEENIYNEFEKLNPSDFMHINSSLDKMAKMQHFGLPTRLLDFSLNPLVALFFACHQTDKDNVQYDARVVVHFSENDDELMSQMICNNAFGDKKDNLPYSLNDMNIRYMNYTDYTIVLPSYITEREIRQSSIFLLFPQIIDFKRQCYTTQIRKIEPDFMKNFFFSIIINSNSKKLILEQLDNIGINSMSLFAELEHSAKYIKEKHKKRVAISIDKLNELIEDCRSRNEMEKILEYQDMIKYKLGDI